LVRIESFPDDFRNAPLDYNLRQKLIIPDCAKEPSRLAKVVALGDGVMRNGERYEFTVAPGDIVLCSRYPSSFRSFRLGEEQVALMSEEEILAKIVVIGGS
jgi:co-chaperonin GroES (HSP10)